MHQSVPSTSGVSVSLQSYDSGDNSQKDSISVLDLSSPQLDSGQRTPVTQSAMGGPGKTKVDSAVPDLSASMAMGDSRSLRREPEPSSAQPPVSDSSYTFEDGNVTVQVEQCLFRVHEYKLQEFETLRPLLADAQKDESGHKTIHVSVLSDDFHRMLAVLYSTAYEPPNFTSGTLKATLRIATSHNHRALRDYAIQNLEKRTLPPIERFALSRDCGIASWMTAALDDLCWREEPITIEEAQILGFEKFTELASRREGVKFERGSRLKLDMVESPSSATTSRQPLPPRSASTPTATSSATSSLLLGTAALDASGPAMPSIIGASAFNPPVSPSSSVSIDSNDRFAAQVREMGTRGRGRARGAFKGGRGRGGGFCSVSLAPAQDSSSSSSSDTD
ncbi:hypothetical protein FRC09_009421 [Ceratobasidium sp. 395]|nr:hypothetical protein FRC09_009421 [Ceratobasidium sp. 395]